MNTNTIRHKTAEEAVAWAELVVQVCTYSVNTIQQEYGTNAARETALLLDPWVVRTEDRVRGFFEN